MMVEAGQIERMSTIGGQMIQATNASYWHDMNDPFRHNLCLLYLGDDELVFNSNVSAIPLANDIDTAGTNCELSGWGQVRLSIAMSTLLLEAICTDRATSHQ